MELALSEAEARFRDEARAFLESHRPQQRLPSMDTAEGFAAHREWERRMAEERWSVVTWPQQYGGRDATAVEWLLFEEEYHRLQCPGRVSQNGIILLAPMLLRYGSAAQRARFLPAMARAEQVWCQGWSEPDSGSDLSSIRSRGTVTGDGIVVTGEKTWCSRGAFADWMFALVRTDPDAQRHRGLSVVLVPLDLPGVSRRPIPQLDGETGFAQIHLDSVEIPLENVVGELHQGWRVAMSTVSVERGVYLRSPGRFRAAAQRLLALREWPDSAIGFERDALWAAMDAYAYELYTHRTVSLAAAGGGDDAASSVNKLFWSELDVTIHDVAMRALGEHALLTDEPWLDGYLFSLAGPIYAGTNDIQRNLVAERVLGLPRAT